MKAWNNASIRAKVTLAFCVVLLAVATLGALSINRMAAIDEAAGSIRDNYLPSTAMSGKIRAAMTRFRQIEATSLRAGNLIGVPASVHRSVPPPNRQHCATGIIQHRDELTVKSCPGGRSFHVDLRTEQAGGIAPAALIGGMKPEEKGVEELLRVRREQGFKASLRFRDAPFEK